MPRFSSSFQSSFHFFLFLNPVTTFNTLIFLSYKMIKTFHFCFNFFFFFIWGCVYEDFLSYRWHIWSRYSCEKNGMCKNGRFSFSCVSTSYVYYIIFFCIHYIFILFFFIFTSLISRKSIIIELFCRIVEFLLKR